MIVARLKPFTTSLIGACARVAQMAASLALVPLLINYLDPEQFAIWLAATSLMAFSRFLDLGMGSHLVNQIASNHSAQSQPQLGKHISSAFFGLSCIGSLVAIMLLLTYSYLPWGRLLGYSSASGDQPLSSVLFPILLSLCATAPLSIIGKIRLGLRESHIHHLWEGATYASTFGAVSLGIFFHAKLDTLLIIYCSIPILILIFNYIALVAKHGSWLAPNIRVFDYSVLSDLLKNGRLFFLDGMFITLCFSVDSLIAFHLLEIHAAAEFGLGQKLALAAQHIISIMLVPFWPVYQNARSSGNIEAGRRAVLQAIALALVLALPASTIIMTSGGGLVSIWTNGAMMMSQDVSIALGAWVPVYALGTALNSVMYTPSVIGIQIKISAASGLATLIIKTTLAMWFGAAGIIWGNAIGYCFFALLPMSFIVWQRLYPKSGHLTAKFDVG
jgi:O-antigen/teichoic acid export membrane protein